MTAKPLRLYTCLNADVHRAVRAAVGNPAQVRLWIVATAPKEAARLLDEVGITAVWQVAGPVRQGPVVATFGTQGLLDAPAVYAYPAPNDDDSPVVRVDSPSRAVRVTTIGEALGSVAKR